MSFLKLSNWLVGVANGYMPSGNLPTETVAATVATSTAITILGGMDTLSKEIRKAPVVGTISSVVGISLVFGSIIFVGHQVGSALRYARKEPSERHNN